jgi:hypothetical protein
MPTSGIARIGARHRVPEALFDARWAVDQDIVEVLFELRDQVLHLLRIDRVLVPGLGCGKQKETLAALVLDQGLLEAALTLDHMDQIVDDPVLQPEDDIQVPKTDVRVDHGHLVSHEAQCNTQVCGGCGLADPTFS